MTFRPLPDGCPHIVWQWEIPADDPSDPDGTSDRGALLTQFATGVVVPSDASVSDDFSQRRREAAAQGLLFAEAPHRCQVDPDTGRELWAVPLAPDLT